jgi:hypothetical protein
MLADKLPNQYWLGPFPLPMGSDEEVMHGFSCERSANCMKVVGVEVLNWMVRGEVSYDLISVGNEGSYGLILLLR